jgi:catechol 2,3-dioxygenase-like lactoylglutathione lyase family enzyme
MKEQIVNVRLHYAIIFVSDMKRSVAFYRDVLGLLLRFETCGFTYFPRCHNCRAHAAAPMNPASLPSFA